MMYNSLKQAWLVNKTDPHGRSAAGETMQLCSHHAIMIRYVFCTVTLSDIKGMLSFFLAGAVAAASREMRAVEIVGLYESQREGLEAELNAAKKEVSSCNDILTTGSAVN
jgi:hypothetical protein